MKRNLLLVLAFLTGIALYGAEPVTGLWKSIDDNTGLPKSITLIYEWNGKIYGRILATFDDSGNFQDSIMNPVKRAENVVGDPYYSGLDIIWNLVEVRNKWSRGKIMDPKPGKVYSCDLWIKDGNLVVRGKIGPFGRNQTWVPADVGKDLPSGFVVPKNPVPTIPEPK